jgi:hypothetical protein
LVAKLRSGQVLSLVRMRLAMLASRLRGESTAMGTARFATAEDVVAVDPSEAVRSSEILKLLTRWFEIVDQRPLGGTLIQPLLSGDIAWNFVQAEHAESLLHMITTIEATLIGCGEIESDFVFVVARPLAEKRQRPDVTSGTARPIATHERSR